MNFAEFIRKLGVSENILFSEKKAVVILAKVDEMYNILKSVLASHFLVKES